MTKQIQIDETLTRISLEWLEALKNDDPDEYDIVQYLLAQAQQEAVKRERERIKGIIECMGGFPRKGNLRKVLLANIEREWFGDMAKYNPEAPQKEEK